jgi:hypothetical protein
MTLDVSLQQLRNANPASADDRTDTALFEAIVATSGDPRLDPAALARRARHRKSLAAAR